MYEGRVRQDSFNFPPLASGTVKKTSQGSVNLKGEENGVYLKADRSVRPDVWHMPITPALRRQKQKDHGFKINLSYIVSSRPACLKTK